MYVEPAESLKLISKAWGRQRGYCFFPFISGSAADKKERIVSYTEGPAFRWPQDRERIIAHLNAHTDDDLYWCPSLFEGPKRRMELAMDEHALWADLDEVDPRGISDYPPTIAWQTSPGRYQALWLITGGDLQGASWAGKENQRLTYHLGADQSGWDTTQLLRLPGWKNHKPDYRKAGKPAQGKLLWQRGRQYLPDEFGDLPEVANQLGAITDVLEDEIDHVDRLAVWARVRLKVSKRVRDLMGAREATGDRSDILWEIERDLADAGCTVTEIVAIMRASVWNKYQGRSDELRRLTTEAVRAIAARPAEVSEKLLEVTQDRPAPTNMFELLKNLKAPTWLIRDILTKGAVGFIAGQPKSFKSWAALDMALSVASGQPFLGHFAVEEPGPVLYIQEEDSAPLVKSRLGKVWPNKMGDKVSMEGGFIEWLPGTELEGFPDIDAYIGQTLTISDETWQAWLDETLENKARGDSGGYKLLVMDPLMMMAGDVEENRAQEMTTKIFRPLKEIARKHGCSIQMVHHMRKGDPKAGPQRGGQMLLGSVANHAWAEDSLYFKLGRGGDVICEQESKSAPVPGFRLTGIRNRRWTPQITVNANDNEREPDGADGPVRKARGQSSPDQSGADKRPGPRATGGKALKALLMLGKEPQFAKQIAETAGCSVPSVYNSMANSITHGFVIKVGTQFQITEKGIKAAS
jgi:hypothetical protein